MIVEDNTNNEQLSYGDLDLGDCFLYNKSKYIKAKFKGESISINLVTGRCCNMYSHDIIVTKVRARLLDDGRDNKVSFRDINLGYSFAYHDSVYIKALGPHGYIGVDLVTGLSSHINNDTMVEETKARMIIE